LWQSGPSNGASINYYDSVMFLYQQHYRTGRTKWKTWAEWGADYWWENPWRDSGRTAMLGSVGSRSWSLTGLTVRYLGGRTDMLPGLRNVWNYYTNPSTSFALYPGAIQNCNANGTCNYGGERENGYRMQWGAECAIVEDDPAGDPSSLRDQCRTAIINGGLLWRSVQCKSGYGTCPYYHNHWLANYGSQGKQSFSSAGYVGSQVRVITGRADVELIPVDLTWTPDQFTANTYFWASTDGTINSFTDTDGYRGPTYVDGTHLTLPEAYKGTGCPAPNGCLKGWHLGPVVGRATQSFMMGIISGAFATGHEATGDSLLGTLSLEGSTWIKDYGYHPDTKGLRIIRYMPGCGEPNPFDNQPGCTYQTSSYASARALSPEVMRALGKAYKANPGQTSLRDFGDTLYGAIFGRSGYTCAPSISSTCLGTFTNNPVSDAVNDKWPGFFFGFGGSLNWPAYRLGSRQVVARTLSIGIKPSLETGATKVRVTLKDPNNVQVAQQTCTTSPCALTIPDADIGGHLRQMEYLDSSNKVLRADPWIPVTVER
jgi:hypothetical protein